MDPKETTDALRAKIAELEGALASAEHRAQKLEAIFDAAPAMMWETQGDIGTPEYRVTYVSRQIEVILGYSREEWTQSGMFWLSRVHPDDKPRLSKASREISRVGGNPPEHRFVGKDGRVVWVQPYIRLIRDASGATTGRVVLALDVTERRQAQEARAALTRRLDSLIASVPGVVWEAQGDAEAALSQLEFVSRALTNMIGYAPEEAVNNPAFWEKVIHPEDRARVGEEIRGIYERGDGTLQLRWIAKNGRVLWVESHVHMLRDEAGAPTGACGVTMDITRRKLAEDAAVRHRDEVINAQAAILAELGTPLIPISSEVLVMPLIGAIDTQRAERVIEALLQGIAGSRARFAILDVTGVPSVDTRTADTLVRAARSVRLLGANVVLTGIRPEVAQTLVGLGIELQGIVTCSTLQSGIAYATRAR